MLVFARKRDEAVIIHQGGKVICRVVVVEAGHYGAKCRLDFQADKSIEIDREEVFRSKHPGVLEKLCE